MAPPSSHILTRLRQAIYSVFGGKVDVTGEILHGKTSPLQHDGEGIYVGIPQEIPVTRYHSLAGMHPTLPDCLEMSSWTRLASNNDKFIVMGVRHKEYAIEGVQFHPESILTAEGRTMLRNFLQMQGGTWAENKRLVASAQPSAIPSRELHPKNGVRPEDKNASILDRIYARRKQSVTIQKEVPSLRPSDLQAAYDLNLAPPLISFPERLKQSPYALSLMAEIKRASPSKGMIDISACAPSQARTYAHAGASVISVLTEPEWFKGSIDDLRAVRQCLDGMPHRPAVLRKEFIFEEYQILEARLAGADTVLLIVKMLEQPLLERLYRYSLSLHMEPLVEVNTAAEMQVAVDLGAKVIGVNNRNLSNFEVDLETTSRLMSIVPKETMVCALSGISGQGDVAPYIRNGVGAVLIGEALMKAKNTAQFVSSLLPPRESQVEKNKNAKLLVKICGTRSAEAARVAIESGADLIGIILVTGRKRCVSTHTALEISRTVHSVLKPHPDPDMSIEAPQLTIGAFEHSSKHLSHPRRAFLVGVFLDQPLEYIQAQQKLLSLDLVQLHGSEPAEWAKLIPVPVIKRFTPTDHGIGQTGYHAMPLLDSAIGGTGQRLDLSDLKTCLHSDRDTRYILAGGLNAQNLAGVVRDLADVRYKIHGVDVSSGVEENGEQSLEKIRSFVSAAKNAS